MALVSGDGSMIEPLRRAYGGDDLLADPQDWWRAARTGIKEVLRRSKVRAEQIRCIGLTGDEACVALDKAGKVLCPTVLGPDPRAEATAKQLQSRVGTRNLLNLAGAMATSTALAPKLLWLRENEKRTWHDLHFALSAKDFLRFRLTDTAATDACEAGSTLLYNPRTRSWSRQLMSLLEINPDWLPPVGAAAALSGRVTEAAARESGLAAGTPVVTGAAHAAALAIAAGATGPGRGVVELGGTGALFIPVAEVPREL
jgi:xylulokinase